LLMRVPFFSATPPLPKDAALTFWKILFITDTSCDFVLRCLGLYIYVCICIYYIHINNLLCFFKFVVRYDLHDSLFTC
jgi:hypothetical protein